LYWPLGKGFSASVFLCTRLTSLDIEVLVFAMGFAHTHMLVLCWTLLTLSPSRLVNPTHEIFFPTKDDLSAMLAYVTFAPTILKLLAAAASPTINLFRRLPSIKRSVWGVYLVLMEKRGCRPKVYIGSGTNSLNGVHMRSRDYYRPKSKNISRRIKKALTEGYRITRIGILCQTPIPSAMYRYRLRSLFIILETAFAFTLWTMHSRTKSYGVPKLLPWAIEALEYDGLCGHSPLWEEIVDENLGLTPEQIAFKEVEAAIRAKQSARRAERRYHARLRRKDPGAYITSMRAKNKRGRDTVKDQARFPCKPCKANFQSAGALEIHETRAEHIATVTGVTKKEVVDAIKTAKTYYCQPCDKAFATSESLTRHKKQSEHIAKVAEESS
jgi:hypothetical protein